MKESNTSELVKFYVDISGCYENVSLEISVNRRLNETPVNEHITRLFHSHPNYEFFYVKTEGFAIHPRGGKPLRLNPGDVCIIPPFCEHYTLFDRSPEAFGKGLFVVGFSFYEAFATASRNLLFALDSFLNKTKGMPLVIRAEGIDTALFESILESFEAALANELLKTAFLDFCKLLELLLQNEKVKKPALSRTDIIRKLDYLISSCYMYDIRLSELAERFYISERSLNRIVSEYYHDTFHGLLTKRRMRIAAAYLENTDFSIAKIAELSGYDSISNFYTAFKKYFGVRPADYRSTCEKA